MYLESSESVVQGYINNFRRYLAPHLKLNIGVTCHVYPAQEGGAVLSFIFGQGFPNDDVIYPVEKALADALAKVPQRAFGGNLGGFRFGGTNVVMEDNRVILIKGDWLPSEWDDNAAKADVMKILRPVGGAEK